MPLIHTLRALCCVLLMFPPLDLFSPSPSSLSHAFFPRSRYRLHIVRPFLFLVFYMQYGNRQGHQVIPNKSDGMKMLNCGIMQPSNERLCLLISVVLLHTHLCSLPHVLLSVQFTLSCCLLAGLWTASHVRTRKWWLPSTTWQWWLFAYTNAGSC